MNRGAWRTIALGALLWPGVAGCYDGERIVERVRAAAMRSHAVEIDLGQYLVSLPRDQRSGERLQLAVHLAGQLPRYRLPDAQAQIEQFRPLMRDRTIIALRSVTQAELAEPDFTQLRQRLTQVTNELLADYKVDELLFQDVRVERH